MNKRLLALMLVCAMAASLTVGCGSNSDSDEKKEGASDKTEGTGEEEEISPEEAKQQELMALLNEASEKLASESVWGYKDTNVTVYENGDKEETTSSKTVDTQNQVVMSKYHFTTNDQLDFYTKEGDKEYQYTQVSQFDEKKGEDVSVDYKVLLDKDSGSGYTQMASPMKFSGEDTEWVEYVEYKLEDMGEEDGAVKIKLEEKFKRKEVFTEITRESVLEERGWTEDDVKMIEGASEALDAYIAENEANIEMSKDKVYEQTTIYWLSKDDHKLMKSENNGYAIESKQEASSKFYTLGWRIDEVKSEIENGVSKEEAVKFANEMEIEESEPMPAMKESTYYVEYVTGEDCVPMEKLPENAKEITWEQYMNGEY